MKNAAKNHGWVAYLVASLALALVLPLLAACAEEAPAARAAPITISTDSGSVATLIPYEILNRRENRVLDKVELWIEVPLVEERLPSAEELSLIATRLVGVPRPSRTYVYFLLPGMQRGAGAYATAHYLPEPEGVNFVPSGLWNTAYEHLDPELMEVRRAIAMSADRAEQPGDPQNVEMEFVRDTWICPTPGPIETGQVFPLGETFCNKVSAGMVWISMSGDPENSAPEAVSPGVISVMQGWGTESGPWFMASDSLSVSPF